MPQDRADEERLVTDLIVLIGYSESFTTPFRDEPLFGEVFYSLREAQILIEELRKHYNTKRPRSALRYCPPAPETIVQMQNQRLVNH